MALLGHAVTVKPRVTWALGVGSETEVDAMVRHQQVDLRVHDSVALDEIELYSEILGAVAMAERRLTTAEIDTVLGVSPAMDELERIPQE
jgi:hypothetical protein